MSTNDDIALDEKLEVKQTMLGLAAFGVAVLLTAFVVSLIVYGR